MSCSHWLLLNKSTCDPPPTSCALREMPTDHRNHKARFIAFLAPTGILFFGSPRPRKVAPFGISRQNPSRLTEGDPPGGFLLKVDVVYHPSRRHFLHDNSFLYGKESDIKSVPCDPDPSFATATWAFLKFDMTIRIKKIVT